MSATQRASSGSGRGLSFPADANSAASKPTGHTRIQGDSSTPVAAPLGRSSTGTVGAKRVPSGGGHTLATERRLPAAEYLPGSADPRQRPQMMGGDAHSHQGGGASANDDIRALLDGRK